MSYRVDAVVIGAGVVGLACARRLALAGLETIVLESEKALGQGISSRNSEVIHAGVYYRPGSLKAKLCRKGSDQLYDYCQTRKVSHQRVGKLIVATTNEQLVDLSKIRDNAAANGCDNLQFLDNETARSLEPALNCVGALLSPSTGIVDSHALMISLAGEIEANGGAIAYSSPVLAGEVTKDGVRLQLGDTEESVISAQFVINSAGLEAPVIAASLRGFPPPLVPPRCFAKGSYFSLAGQSPFSHLIYPVPERGGLGVHLTLDLAGQARFGPDVEWVDTLDYSVDARKAKLFLESIRQYWPGCSLDKLQPAYAGIRPKLGNCDRFSDDFEIQCERTHQIPGLVNLFGIESPGLTSCLAIADEVAARININYLNTKELS